MVETSFTVGDLCLSGRERRPDSVNPKAIILALHGGGYGAAYWDFPPTSLLTIAADRGYLGIAIDRPGYGTAFDRSIPLERQADIILDLVEHLLEREGSMPVLLAGHSMGGILTLMIGARSRASKYITAIDVCGVPIRYSEAMQAVLLSRRLPVGETHFPAIDATQSRQAFFGAAGTYTKEALLYDAMLHSPVPGAELPDAANAPRDLPAIMQRNTLPVRLSFAEDERSSIATPKVASDAQEYLSASSRSVIRFEPHTGHNISLHSAGCEFHHGMIDWLESIKKERHDPRT